MGKVIIYVLKKLILYIFCNFVNVDDIDNDYFDEIDNFKKLGGDNKLEKKWLNRFQWKKDNDGNYYDIEEVMNEWKKEVIVV